MPLFQYFPKSNSYRNRVVVQLFLSKKGEPCVVLRRNIERDICHYFYSCLNNLVVYQNLQISGMHLDKLSILTKSSKSVGLHCKNSPILMISGSPSAFCSSRSKIPRSKRTFISVTWTLLESISKGAITNISNLAFAFCCTSWWSQWLNWRKLPWCPLDFEHFTFYI